MRTKVLGIGLGLCLALCWGVQAGWADAISELNPGWDLEDFGKALKAQSDQMESQVQSWRTKRQSMVDALVAKGATRQEADEAIGELIASGDAQVKAGAISLTTTTPKLSALNEKLAMLAGISNLGPARFETFIAAQGLSPGKKFYDCLCEGGFWYAPAADGACEGRTAAYGNVVHANMSTDPAVWIACAAQDMTSGRPLTDALVDRMHTARQRYDRDVCTQLRTILDATKAMKTEGKLHPPGESMLAGGPMESTFLASLLSGPLGEPLGDIGLNALIDKSAARVGIADKNSPTGLGYFLTHSDQPSQTGLGNPYVRITKVITGAAAVAQNGRTVNMSYEMALARRIIRSNGALSPGDVFAMAVDVTSGDVPLAALVAHNLLKEAAYGRRNNQPMALVNIPKSLKTQDPEADAIKEAYADAFDRKGQFAEKEFIADPDLIRSKLQDIRPPYDPQIDDRLGPWYHTFGLIFAGTNPAIGESRAYLAAATENVTRLLNLGSGRSLGKEAANRCAAVLVSLMNRNMEQPSKH